SGALDVSDANLTLSDGARLRYQGLVNAANGRPDLAPGTLASLFGERLTAPGREGDVRVTVAGLSAHVVSVTASQINLIIPETAPLGAVEYTVFNGSQESDPMLADLRRSAPGIFRAVEPSPAAEGGFGLLVTGLGPIALANPASVFAFVGGVRLPAAA